VWHDSFICVTWRIHMCDMTHSYVWHDSFICVTHSYAWHDSIARVIYREGILGVLPAVALHNTIWLIHVWYDSIMCVIHLWSISGVAWRSVAWRCWLVNTQKSHMYIQETYTYSKETCKYSKESYTNNSSDVALWRPQLWCPQDVWHILEVLQLMCVKRDLCVWK